MFKVAALMTCFNRVKVTLACLEHLFAVKLPSHWQLDVWLVDDASPDKTGPLVKARYPHVHVIESEGNLYWSKGMRLAWDSATQVYDYDAYLWLNDDVMVFADAFETLQHDRDWVDNSSECVFLGACQAGKEDTTISHSGSFYDGRKAIPNGKSPLLINPVMSGNFVFVPQIVFQKIGPIYDGFMHGHGDLDYGLRTEKAGIKRYLCSKPVGICPHQPERYLHLKGRPLAGRLKLLFEPKGYPIHDTILLRYRNQGVLRMLVSIFHILAIVIFAIEPKANKAKG